MIKIDSPIAIRSAGFIAPFGCELSSMAAAFSESRHFFKHRERGTETEWVAPLTVPMEERLQSIRASSALNRFIDRGVLMGISAARDAVSRAGWRGDSDVGVMIGSSRGATETLEHAYQHFYENRTHRAKAVTSPTTTLGNFSTAIAQDLLLSGPELSHSITCSSALHALVNAIGWMRAGFCKRVIAGGAEAALTEFTLAQMKALRIYTSGGDGAPCRPFERNAAQSTFALGEGAAVFALEEKSPRNDAGALAGIAGMGWGIERVDSLTGVSADGEAFYESMRRALESRSSSDPIDALVAHAPGTLTGDRAEMSAITRLFGERRPVIVSPKWQIGHTFGASGAFGLLYAIHLLHGGRIAQPPFETELSQPRSPVSSVMVNAAGFGGNVCSIILRRWS